jgi:hypothetical protein
MPVRDRSSTPIVRGVYEALDAAADAVAEVVPAALARHRPGPATGPGDWNGSAQLGAVRTLPRRTEAVALKDAGRVGNVVILHAALPELTDLLRDGPERSGRTQLPCEDGKAPRRDVRRASVTFGSGFSPAARWTLASLSLVDSLYGRARASAVSPVRQTNSESVSGSTSGTDRRTAANEEGALVPGSRTGLNYVDLLSCTVRRATISPSLVREAGGTTLPIDLPPQTPNSSIERQAEDLARVQEQQRKRREEERQRALDAEARLRAQQTKQQ